VIGVNNSKSKHVNFKRKNNWISYQLAKHVIATSVQKPSSMHQYRRWHDRNKPVAVPKYPEKCYTEWTGWNDYLGNDNEFIRQSVKRPWRNYWDAMKYVHALNLSTTAQFIEARNRDDWPDDIPAAPHSVYSEWDDYPTWLGVTLRARIDTLANMSKCVALCTMAGQPDNIVKVVTCEQGVDQLDKMVKESKGGLFVFKMYKYSAGDLEVMNHILRAHAMDQGDCWLVPNMNQLLFELNSHLEWWRG
jgi:hypothetical protein